MSPAKGIKDILLAKGVQTGDWKLYVGKMPDGTDADDEAIAILDTGGKDAFSNLLIDFPTVQILVRGTRNTGYETAYAKMEEIRNHLLGMPGQPAEYEALTSCTQRGHINPLGYDKLNRPEFSLNFNLITEPAAVPGGHRS